MENDAPQRPFLSDWIEGEVAAGFVFADAARECRVRDTARFELCLSGALDCCSLAAGYLSHAGLSKEQRQILALNLNELRRRLDLLRENKLAPSAAA